MPLRIPAVGISDFGFWTKRHTLGNSGYLLCMVFRIFLILTGIFPKLKFVWGVALSSVHLNSQIACVSCRIVVTEFKEHLQVNIKLSVYKIQWYETPEAWLKYFCCIIVYFTSDSLLQGYNYRTITVFAVIGKWYFHLSS